ncbi:fatty acid-binding protein-like [Oppia nitens]|uniref:fatty acid-binding protein-like n=1 Tax=Oppia nitens TaxID=1686743 RepID=UPI0023DA9F93|nr:fatty acid-binding protein-like [Oppia nitens]
MFKVFAQTISDAVSRAMAEFAGKWKLDKSDNFDNFLKELGINFMMRKMAGTASPTVEISRDGDSFTFKTITSIKTSSVTFTLGQEFEEERLDGKKVKSVMTLDGNKLIQTQVDNGKEVKYVREFNGDVLTVTSTANGVVCVRVYKRL